LEKRPGRGAKIKNFFSGVGGGLSLFVKYGPIYISVKIPESMGRLLVQICKEPAGAQ